MELEQGGAIYDQVAIVVGLFRFKIKVMSKWHVTLVAKQQLVVLSRK